MTTQAKARAGLIEEDGPADHPEEDEEKDSSEAKSRLYMLVSRHKAKYNYSSLIKIYDLLNKFL